MWVVVVGGSKGKGAGREIQRPRAEAFILTTFSRLFLISSHFFCPLFSPFMTPAVVKVWSVKP